MLILTVVLGCTPNDDLTASGAPSAHVPSVLWVTFDGPEGTGFVEYGIDDFALQTPQAEGVGHEIAVMGLKAGRSYQWRAVVLDDRGKRHESETGVFDVPIPPVNLKQVDVTVAEPESAVSYVLAAVIAPPGPGKAGESFAAILDRDGDWVWWVSSGTTVIVTPELSLDGRSILWNQYDFGKFDDVGQLIRVSLDGKDRTESRMHLGHHDFAQHAGSNEFAFLGISFADIQNGPTTYRMGSDTIALGFEGMTDADEAPILFDMFDDYPLEPLITCEHISSAEDKLGERDVLEWTHGNSFMYVAEEDAYFINTKFTDWLIKVDAGTGEVVWSMNGRGGDFTQPDGSPVWQDVSTTSLWSHGHMSDIWSGGGMMFDNGDHHTPRVSSALEFAWDDQAMTAQVVWEYPHPQGRSSFVLGDVRKMPNDNVLITWSVIGGVVEVTRDKRTVWNADTSPDNQFGRIVPVAELYGK